MDTLRLAKHHGLGNDFLVALVSEDQKAVLDSRGLDWTSLAQRMCHRREGVGADGLLLGIGPAWSAPTWSESATSGSSCPDGRATVRMVLFNSDGSRAGMSGNGAACLANAVAHGQEPWSHRIKRLQEAYLSVEIATDSGIRNVQWRSPYVEGDDGAPIPLDTHVDVVMPIVEPGPPICADLDTLISESFGGCARRTGDVGNPHLVIATGRQLEAEETARLGALYEGHFEDGINVEFIWPLEETPGSAPRRGSTLGMTVWERGAGLTEACGTGAVVAATSAREWGLVNDDIFTSVVMPGGLATIAQASPGQAPQLQVWTDHVADVEWPLRGPWLDA